MSKFIPQRGTPAPAGVAKFVAGTGAGPVLEKVGAGEAELGLQGRVQHVNGDGIVNDLSRLVPSIYAALPNDPRLLTRSEKELLLAQAIEAMRQAGTYTAYGESLVRRIVGLDSLDGQVDSPRWETQGAANSVARDKENGGYRRPQEPANRPSSVAKSDDMAALIRQTRAQIQAIVKRIEALQNR